MKKYKGSFLVILIVSFFSSQLTAQSFKDEIAAFQKLDDIQMPKAGGILFVGSSSFTKWVDVNDYFPGFPITNRGFGGSSLTDVIFYSESVILKYKPKQIYIYCGENDIAASDSITPEIVFNRFKQLYSIIRKNLDRKIQVVYVSIKPSIARWKYEQKFVETNSLIKEFLSKKKHNLFLDVHSAMLESDRSVKKDIFIGDQLHMNAKGYKIWQGIIMPTLLN